MAEFDKGALAGGESVLLGLIRGLTRIERRDYRITILTTQSMHQALATSVPAPHRVVYRQAPLPRPMDVVKVKLRKALESTPSLLTYLRSALHRPSQGLPDRVPALDPFACALNPDLIHWIYPLHYATSDIPSVCTVHDLNYEHLPEQFTRDYIRWRRELMSAQVLDADGLIAISDFVAADVRNRYPTAEQRLGVIRWAPFITNSTRPVALPPTSHIHEIGDGFLLYPAATYTHKNHKTLIEAIRILNRGRQPHVRLILTGPVTPEWTKLEKEALDLISSQQITHLGFVTEQELIALFRKSCMIVFPSQFEGAGLPVIEAIAMGKPICCSDLAVFREYGLQYPTYFDPSDPAAIAAAIEGALAVGRTPDRPPARDWDLVAAEHLSFYDAVLAKRGYSATSRAACLA